jgi:nicotinate-nucleotide pyrophosphorylase (carboxylating)
MRSQHDPPHLSVVAAVTRALEEDLVPLGDITSALLPGDVSAVAAFVARSPGVLAGRVCAEETLRQVDERLTVEWSCADGDEITEGLGFGEISGPLISLLTAERTALNFLSHLSGVATVTRRYVEAIEASGGTARVWDTRKTTPGLRALEKAAVRAGGGANHRGNLSDWILVKDNHLEHLPVAEAVRLARERWPARTVHIECDTERQARQAIEAGADALLLDNMTVEEVRSCVAMVDETVGATGLPRPLLEVSGGVSVENIGRYAASGVDFISVGRLTNSAPALDIGLDIKPEGRS